VVVLNRVQLAVLAFFGLVYLVLVIILIAAPEVYEGTFRDMPSPHSTFAAVFLIVLSMFLLVLGAGVIRRWRWVFWGVLLAFLAGGLRIPVSVLQLSGLVPSDTPKWYVGLQGLIGAAQLAVGMVMLVGYRRGGVWGVRPDLTDRREGLSSKP
jgi:fucose 4-O-acetylase-like acetyltransferase